MATESERQIKKNTELLIRIDERVGVINKKLNEFCGELTNHEERIDGVEVWQKDWDSQKKVLTGAAAFIGGIVVFLIDKIWDFFVKR